MLSVAIQDTRILDIVLHHHERLDGPELSESVRLVTICDTYAAMTEFRPYVLPLSPRMALETM